jgi:hypothetical protein
MGSYDNGRVTGYLFQAVDFGGGSDLTEVIMPPKDGPDTTTAGSGRRGRVVGVSLFNISETFVGTTSGAAIQVGDGSDADLYFDTGNTTLAGSSPAINTGLWMPDDGSKVDIPAGETAVTITFVATVGGSVTGIADVLVEIEWFGPPQ